METYMGTVLIWAPNFAPRSFAYCAGQLISVSQFTALFSLLGTNTAATAAPRSACRTCARACRWAPAWGRGPA